MDVRSTQPDANVVFYPFVYEDVDNAPKGREMEVAEISAQDHLIEIQTSKAKGQAGSFSILLGSGINWKSILNAGSWCLIYMSDQKLTGEEQSDTDSGLKMIGIIRSVRKIEKIDPQTGIKSVRYLVTGQDFHSVFETPIYLNANMTEVTKGQGFSQAAALLIFGKNMQRAFTPSDLVKALVDGLLGRPQFEGERSGAAVSKVPVVGPRTGQPYKIPQPIALRILGKRAPQDFFTGAITFFLQKDLIGKYVNIPEVTGTQSVWSILEGYCHRLLNELYTELLPVNVDGKTRLVPSLVLRSIPFSSKPKKPYAPCISMLEAGGTVAGKLTSGQRITATRNASGIAVGDTKGRKKVEVNDGRGAHLYVSRDISEGEVLGFNVGKSDRERFNFFLVFPNIGQQFATEVNTLKNIISSAGLANIANLKSLARYGLRPYINSTPYIDIASPGANISRVNDIIRDLWAKAANFESGQVELIGIADYIPVGTNIRFLERGWLAHVEQVDNVFRVDPGTGIKAFRTVCSFVRLQTLNGLPTDLTEASDDEATLKMINEYGLDRGATFVKTEK